MPDVSPRAEAASSPISGSSRQVALVQRVYLRAILFGFSFWTFGAQAQDKARTLEIAAGHLHACIAQQTAAELAKHTTPRRFGIVLRDNCRAHEQRFKSILIGGLKQERALTPHTRQLVNEMLASLRRQSVANYAEVIKHHSTELPK